MTGDIKISGDHEATKTLSSAKDFINSDLNHTLKGKNMEEQIIRLVLYFVYYIAFPFLLMIAIWKLWEKKNHLAGKASFSPGSEDDSASKDDLKKLQIFFVISLLIFMPVMNFTASNLSEIGMSRDRIYFGAFGQSAIYDPVNRKIGPSMDTDYVIEQMEERPDYWLVEDVQDQIDFEDITRMPGRLTVYHITKDTGWSHIVITYHYFSPLPVIRTIGFRIYDMGEEAVDEAILEVEKTIFYPLDPASSDPF